MENDGKLQARLMASLSLLEFFCLCRIVLTAAEWGSNCLLVSCQVSLATSVRAHYLFSLITLGFCVSFLTNSHAASFPIFRSQSQFLFHPQTDGKCRDVPSTRSGEDWLDLLPLAGFCYYSSSTMAAGTSQFIANHRQRPATNGPRPTEALRTTSAIQLCS